jgi:transcriptional regulator with XRE-family HTH domain
MRRPPREYMGGLSLHTKENIMEVARMTIGERIKIIRKGEGLNQIEFANRISVSQGRLSEIESGVAMPSVETIKLIIKEFSCDVNWLLDIPVVHFSLGQLKKIDCAFPLKYTHVLQSLPMSYKVCL